MSVTKAVTKSVDVAAAAASIEAEMAVVEPLEEIEELGEIYVTLAMPDILLWDSTTGIKFSGSRIVKTPLNMFVSVHMAAGKLRQATKEEYYASLKKG